MCRQMERKISPDQKKRKSNQVRKKICKMMIIITQRGTAKIQYEAVVTGCFSQDGKEIIEWKEIPETMPLQIVAEDPTLDTPSK